MIVILLPGSGTVSRYADLVAQGKIRLKAATTSDLDHFPRYDLPSGAPDPLEAPSGRT